MGVSLTCFDVFAVIETFDFNLFAVFGDSELLESSLLIKLLSYWFGNK